MEPALHQVEIPPAEDFLLHSRVCALMENYDLIKAANRKSEDKTFNFSSLAGLSRAELEALYFNSKEKTRRKSKTPQTPPSYDDILASCQVGPQVDPQMDKLKAHFIEENRFPHPCILRSILQCAEDLVVKGHFQESYRQHSAYDTGSDVSQLQVTIFSSEKHRQLIICYRGSMSQHTKPLHKNSKRYIYSQLLGTKESILHPNQPVSVHPSFKRAYFANDIEEKVFRLLEDHLAFNPFCDVVMTGHSFGGALATIGATRFAALFPMITVSCHAFGTPKVGGIKFRHFCNSLPNLKVRTSK